MGFFKKLVSGLSKTRNNIVSGLNSIFMVSVKSTRILRGTGRDTYNGRYRCRDNRKDYRWSQTES